MLGRVFHMSDLCKSFIYTGGPIRLDRAVFKQLNVIIGCSRSQVERWVESRAVKVNNRVVIKPAFKVESGDLIEVVAIDDRKYILSPYSFKLSVLFEDEHLIVINKPSGLSMHPGAGNREETLANAVVSHVGAMQLQVGESDRPGIVHRLDKDTTGVVVVAKSTPVHAALAKQFAERTIERTYTALVFTTPRARRPIQHSYSGEISAPIGRHPTHRKLMTVISTGRAAITRWMVLERFAYGTLIQCKLETGRTHQIRVHLNHIGCPVIGDRTYGDFSNLPARLRDFAEAFGRQALHAATLSFAHPISGERISFSAPLPDDYEKLVNLFRDER